MNQAPVTRTTIVVTVMIAVMGITKKAKITKVITMAAVTAEIISTEIARRIIVFTGRLYSPV